MYKPHSWRNRTLHYIWHTLHNYFCECCVRLYWWKPVTQFSEYALWTPITSLVVTSWLLTCTDLPWCGWSIVGTNFLEWVQKNSFWGGTNFRGSKRELPKRGNQWKTAIANSEDPFAIVVTVRQVDRLAAQRYCARLPQLAVSKKFSLKKAIFAGTNFCELVLDCENFSFCLAKISHYTVGLAACNWYEHLTVKPDYTGCHWTKPF